MDNTINYRVCNVIFSRGSKEYWRRILEIATEFCPRFSKFHEIFQMRDNFNNRDASFFDSWLKLVVLLLVLSATRNKAIVIHNKKIREFVKFIFKKI